MTSLIDSFKETIAGKTAIFKAVILATPLFYSYQILTTTGDFNQALIITAITLFILFGFLLESTHQNIQGEVSGMIALNPFRIIWAGFLGIISIAPLSLALIAIVVPLVSVIKILPAIDLFFQIILTFLALAIVFTQILLLASKNSIKEAYDFKTIYLRCGDTMLALFKYCIGAALLNGVTFILFGYIIHAFLGFGIWLNGYIAIAIIYNISIMGHYLAQIQHDIIEFPRIENVII